MSLDNPLERRDRNERRNLIHGAQFPIITRRGVCVCADRRRQPERRISNIEVGEKLLKEDTFQFLFSEYSKNN